MPPCILSIDQGTSGTTCLVIAYADGKAQILGRGYAELPQHFPQPGWVEHDLLEIWHSVGQAATQALRQANLPAHRLQAIGITNQRETVCLWDAAGQPMQRAIVWQDRRTTAACTALAEAGHAAELQQRTGLVIDPYFSASKLQWTFAQRPDWRQAAEAGRLRFGTVDSWLIWQLTGGQRHVTDVTNASRTQLYNICTGGWDPHLCALFGDVPVSLLPEVLDNCDTFGTTRGAGFVADGIPITGVAGDQQAALVGQACLHPGMAKCTYGTGAFVLTPIGQTCTLSQQGLLTTIAHRLNGEVTYALEGSIFVAGAVVQWLRDGLQMISDSSEIEALARQVSDSGGVALVPALTGLGAPHWQPQARGLLCGISRGTTRGHIARAALEGIAFQVADLLRAMQADSGVPLRALRVDGGAAANDLLIQFQADLLGISLQRPRQLESTALGAAHLAALGAGFLEDISQVERIWQVERSFARQTTEEAAQAHLARWRAAVRRTVD
jgi:glycerol kinase